jgi:hypothetical protein
MKRVFIMLAAATAVVGCAEKKQQEIVIDDQNAMTVAEDMSFELGYMAYDAQSYEEFKKVRVELEKYEEAFRDQIGGEAYLKYLEETNSILSEL